jgi:hypothetical protein
MKKKYVYTFITCIGVFFISEAGVRRSLQPPFNYTGADGSTCAQCHGNLNNGGGQVTTSGLPVGQYAEGQSYDFSITIAHPETRGRWGFAITARDTDHQPVGSFSTTNPNAALNINELSHFNAVHQTGTSFTYDRLKWTAPVQPTAAQKTVTFYYIANAANGDGSTTGDFIYPGTARSVLAACTAAGFATGEGYMNIPGTQVAQLTANPAYPNNPSITAQLNSLEYTNLGNNYGGRLRGYICAPQTGNYTFYIVGDDQAGLFLSTDSNAANKVLVAYNELPVGFRQWTRYATQKSAPIQLVKGMRYYFETLHKQATGANHLSVGWIMPDGTQEGPIPGNRLSPITGSSSLVTSRSFGQALQALPLPGPSRLTVKATPNPSIDHFTITTRSNNDARINLLLTDVHGKVMEQRANIAANGTWQLGSRLQAGIYFLEVTQGTQKEILKLIRK